MKGKQDGWYRGAYLKLLFILSLIISLSFFLTPWAWAQVSLTPEEQKILELVNEERFSHNLPSLEIDEELINLARFHSQEMVDLNYFDHESPNSGDLLERLQEEGLTGWFTAAENLAGAPNAKVAFKALMDSPTHRENILNKELTHIGVGIAKGGPYGKMFTQEFLGKEEATLLSHFKVTPLKNEVEISFELASPAYVNLGLYNAKGEQVAEIIRDKYQEGGPFKLRWQGKIKEESRKNSYNYEYRLLAQNFESQNDSAAVIKKINPSQVEVEEKGFPFLSFLLSLFEKLLS